MISHGTRLPRIVLEEEVILLMIDSNCSSEEEFNKSYSFADPYFYDGSYWIISMVEKEKDCKWIDTVDIVNRIADIVDDKIPCLGYNLEVIKTPKGKVAIVAHRET